MNIFGKDQRSGLPFPPKIDRKGKRVVSFTHEQNIICCQTKLDDVAFEQTIICMQLFACRVVGCRPMKRKNGCLSVVATKMLPRHVCGMCLHYALLPTE